MAPSHTSQGAACLLGTSSFDPRSGSAGRQFRCYRRSPLPSKMCMWYRRATLSAKATRFPSPARERREGHCVLCLSCRNTDRRRVQAALASRIDCLEDHLCADDRARAGRACRRTGGAEGRQGRPCGHEAHLHRHCCCVAGLRAAKVLEAGGSWCWLQIKQNTLV